MLNRIIILSLGGLWVLFSYLTNIEVPLWAPTMLLLGMGLLHIWLFLRGPGEDKIGVRSLILFFLLTRISSFWSQPFLENDYFRYLWDGIVNSHFENGLIISPDEVLLHQNRDSSQIWREEEISKRHAMLGEAELEELLLKVNYAESPSIYGPVGQAFLGIQTFPWVIAEMINPEFSPSLSLRIHGLRAWLIFLEAIGLMLFWRWQVGIHKGNWSTLLLVTCPLLMKEVSNSLHIDILPMLLVLGAYCSLERREICSSIFLSSATAVKAFPLVLLPLFLLRCQHPIRYGLCYFGVLVGVYLPFWMSGGSEIFAGTQYFSYQWSMNDGLTALFRELLYNTVGDSFETKTVMPIGNVEVSSVQMASRRAGLMVFLTIFICLMVSRWKELRSGQGTVRTLSDTLMYVVLCSPVQNPWYLLWGLPFLIASRNLPGMAMVGMSAFYLFNFIGKPTAHLFDPFQWWVVIVQAMVVMGIYLEWRKSRRQEILLIKEQEDSL